MLVQAAWFQETQGYIEKPCLKKKGEGDILARHPRAQVETKLPQVKGYVVSSKTV